MDIEAMNLLNNTVSGKNRADDFAGSLYADTPTYTTTSKSHTFQFSLSDSLLGLTFCLCLLGFGLYMAYLYRVSEREEIAEAEQRRIEEEKKEISEMESYRVKIVKAIESYAIHLTNMTSRPTVQPASTIDKCNHRTIPDGNDEEDDGVPVETITVKTSISDDMDDIENTDFGESPLENIEDLASTPISIDASDCGSTDSDSYGYFEEGPLPSSSSIITTVTHANLRKAVATDPCAICLEPFRAGDNVVCCSNNMNGQKPHIFHQECSLDYLLAHNEGLNAPCPCCRTLLVPSEEQRKGCLRHSYHSALTLPDLGGSDDSDSEE